MDIFYNVPPELQKRIRLHFSSHPCAAVALPYIQKIKETERQGDYTDFTIEDNYLDYPEFDDHCIEHVGEMSGYIQGLCGCRRCTFSDLFEDIQKENRCQVLRDPSGRQYYFCPRGQAFIDATGQLPPKLPRVCESLFCPDRFCTGC